MILPPKLLAQLPSDLRLDVSGSSFCFSIRLLVPKSVSRVEIPSRIVYIYSVCMCSSGNITCSICIYTVQKQYASHNTHTEILLACGKTYFVITAIVFPFLKLNDAAFDLSNGPVLDEVPKNSAFSNWIHARGFSATKHAYNAHFFAET